MALLEFNQSQKLRKATPRKEAEQEAADELKTFSQSIANRRRATMVSQALDTTSMVNNANEELDNPVNSSLSARPRTSARVSFSVSSGSARGRIGSVLNQRSMLQRMSIYEEQDESDSDTEMDGVRGRNFRFNRNDKRFVNLIDSIKPVYVLAGSRDVNQIVETNDALKSTASVQAILFNVESKKGGRRLAKSAREVISSGDYFYGKLL
jgi:hypothetical protein